MRLWIAGSPDEVVAAVNDGIAEVIVTNPTVVAEWCGSGDSLVNILGSLAERVAAPVYVQLRGPTCDEYMREGKILAAASRYFRPKLPCTWEGLRAANLYAKQGVPALVTTVCSVRQAWLAACAGAGAICPYFARLASSGEDAGLMVRKIRECFDRAEHPPLILPASIRSASDADAALLAGADGLIVFNSLLGELLEHPVSTESNRNFECDDWPRIRVQ